MRGLAKNLAIVFIATVILAGVTAFISLKAHEDDAMMVWSCAVGLSFIIVLGLFSWLEGFFPKKRKDEKERVDFTSE